MQLRIFITVFALLAVSTALCTDDVHAQPVTIRGRVVDADTGDPLTGATVLLRSPSATRAGTATGPGGRFAMAGILPGRYILAISYVGYLDRADTIQVAPRVDWFREIMLEPTDQKLDALIVETPRAEGTRFVAGLETITPSDLQRIPMPDVSYDLAGYLLTLPGFVSAGDRGGQLFVRGGTPTQNLVLLDGMVIYQPFHIVGFYSAFPADIVAYADVYAGGFGAQYGGRISSVIDIATKNGDKRRVRGVGTIAPFLSGVRVEVPVSRGKVSLLLSLRESIIERIAPDLLGQSLPFHFGDQFAKLHAFVSQTSSVAVTVLRSFDEGNIAAGNTSGFDDTKRSTWKNEAYGFRYTYLPADYPALAELMVHYTRLKSTYRFTQDDTRNAEASGMSMRINYSYLLGETQVHFGLFGILNRFNYALGLSQEPEKTAVSSGGMYITGRYLIADFFRMESGFRIESFSHGTKTLFGPRVRGVILPSGPRSKHQFSFAWGRYHQQIIGLNNEQDVSDVFTIWAASPQSTPVPTATHLITGWRARFFPWLEMRVEAYRKNLDNIAFPVFSEAVNRLARFTRVEGEAKGVDFKMEMNRPSFFGSIGYSLARVEYFRKSGQNVAPLLPGIAASAGGAVQKFNPPHDRRHQLNAMVQFVKDRHRLSIRWQFGSGLPFTQVNGYYERLPVFESTDESYRTASGETFVSRSTLYGGELPTYHRLDVSYEREFSFNRTAVTLQIGVINIYNRNNIFEYNIFSGDRVDQLPLIPSVGLKVELE